jgi:hypothetical protein
MPASVTSPANSTSPALFGTDTEFIVAPKLRRGPLVQAQEQRPKVNGSTIVQQTAATEPKRALLRVIASPLETTGNDTNIVYAYVSRARFSRLTDRPLSDLVASMPDPANDKHNEDSTTYTTKASVHLRPCTLQREEPPKDPTIVSSDADKPERQDPLSLSLAQAKAKGSQEEKPPRFVLACCPDAQVLLPIDTDADPSKTRPIELAMVSDGCIGIPRTTLEARKLGISVGDHVKYDSFPPFSNIRNDICLGSRWRVIPARSKSNRKSGCRQCICV